MGINTTITNEIGVFQTMIASGPVIIQNRDGIEKTLLVKHGDKPLAELKWKFCGGKIFAEMDLEANAIREAKEEIGVTVKLIKPLKPMIIWNEIPETGSEKPQAIVLIHYLAEISEEPIMGKEVLAMEWHDINNLPNDCAPNVKPVIEEYLQEYK
ncbi:MAG: NUDIX hydrolase [Candidatus Buchananbacteria bacterium]|jgi:ADP-ribose pyrophosphatase YjhB (NUDIX family)